MTRRLVTLAFVATVVLAGCLGGPMEGSPDDTEPTPTLSGGDVPGVTNGTLTNVSALIETNAASLTETGGEVQVRRTAAGETTGYRLQLGAGGATYAMNGTAPGGSDGPRAVSLWANETTQVVRLGTGGDATYRVVPREGEMPNALTVVESTLVGGQFSVENESTGNGTVVLTADEFSAADRSRFADVSDYEASIVVGEGGLIQEFAVTAATDDRSVTYRYDLRSTGLEQVTRPDWLGDVPATASLQADVEVTIENESYLGIEHRGGDTVPSGSTLNLETDGTPLTTTVPTELTAGDTVYAYRHASNGTLVVSLERPTDESVMPLTSPVSVSLVTDDGTPIVNGGMAWESSSASDGEGTSGGADGEATG